MAVNEFLSIQVVAKHPEFKDSIEGICALLEVTKNDRFPHI